jgi:hypothetical protein
MFVSASTTNDPIGVALRTGTLGQPALVKPYVENTMMDEVWVIPVVAGSGYPSALLEFVYDPAHNRIRAASFDAVGNGMFYASHPFPFVDATQAAAVVQQVRKTSVMVGQTPELIYFPTDHQAVLAGKTTWTGGGETVIDPIWRVPGADGHYSYVAHSQQVYSAGEIPVASSLPVMPDLVG